MEADSMFSTMQMMAKPEIHEQFSKDTFDVIVLDECHHAGSESYQRIMGYFKPK
jgi:superfamily II DNA or RNA helicase